MKNDGSLGITVYRTDLTLTEEQPAQIKCENLYHFGEIFEYLEGNYWKRIFFYSPVDFDENHRNGELKKLIVYTVYMFVDICMQMRFRRTRKAREVVEAKNLY